MSPIRSTLVWLLILLSITGMTRAAEPPFHPDGIPPLQYSFDPARPNLPKQYFLTIYSGSTKGVYYYVASAICEAMRARFAEHRIHCAPFRSQGVASNRSLMSGGRAQLAIVQSDTNYFAATGEMPIDGARSVVSLHDEMGVLVVGKNSHITTPHDLAGKRVNLGPKDSAARALWIEYLTALGMKESDLKESVAFPQDLNYQGVCGNYIDAFGLWSGHPVTALEDAIDRCGLKLVGMWQPELAQLLEERKYYFRSELPAKVYPGQDVPLLSYGIRASLIAHEKTDPYIVYWVARILTEDVAFLRTRHPALARLDPKEMFSRGNFLPFHPGAQRYWDEIGWKVEPSVIHSHAKADSR
jgi:TRAP transporter TAXI family solute receptor